MKRAKSTFGKLLSAYRAYRDVSQTDLCLLLAGQEYVITTSAVNKYEYGDRTPPAEFICQVVRALSLNEEEEAALLDACLADMLIKFLQEYREALRQRSVV